MPKIAVHPSLILWLSVLYYVSGAVVLPFLAAAALHELGHALALYALNKPPRSLRLSFAGAVMEAPHLSYREELLAAAAGPGISLLLCLLAPLWPALGLYSLCLGLFNLLPLLGLDGGRMLRCGLLLHLPEQTANRICRIAAVGTGAVLLLVAVWLWQIAGWGLWPVVLASCLLGKALLTKSL